nr:cytidine deaminase [Paracoccus laeviglucosivorans]
MDLHRKGAGRNDAQANDDYAKGRAMTLLDAAREVRERAYAPYSRFKVGAAVRGASGAVYHGCNVENVAYPEGTCAEAGAIALMIASGETRLTEVAVIADSPSPVPPCGGCRQKLAEFGDADTPVLLATTAGKTLHTTIGALLPGRFDASHMSEVE